MGTQKTFLSDTQFNLVNKGSVPEFLFKKMFLFVSSIWVFISSYIFFLVKFITRNLFRVHVSDNIEKDDSNFLPVLPQEVNQIVSDSSEPELEPEIVDFVDTEYDEFSEKETPKFSFKFQFPSYENTGRGNEESEESVSPKNAFITNTNTSKYQFLPGKDFSGFIEEPEVMNFTVKQLYVDLHEDALENKEIIRGGSLTEKKFLKPNSEIESADEEILNDSYTGVIEEPEVMNFTVKQLYVDLHEDALENKEIIRGGSLTEKKFLKPNSEIESADEEILNDSYTGVIEEPEVMNFTAKQLYFDLNEDALENKEIIRGGSLLEKNFLKPNSEIEYADEERLNDSYTGEEFEKPESVILTEIQLSGKDQLVGLESNSLSQKEISDGVEILSEKEEVIDFDSDSESFSFVDGFSYMNHIMDSNSEEFLSDGDFGDGIELETMIEPNEDIQNSKETLTEKPRTMDPELIENLECPEEIDLQNSTILGTEFLTEGEFCEKEAEQELEQCSGEREDPMNGSENYQEPNLQNSSVSDSEDPMNGSENSQEPILQNSSVSDSEDPMNGSKNSQEPILQNSSVSDSEDPNRLDALWEHQDLREFSRTGPVNGSETQEPNLQNSLLSDSEDPNRLETLWEHQDLIEQLKIELRKVRATGLPTILEESESPKVVDDLKPWKIDEKFLHEDQIGELHKFYKIYRERMRKFDILNYQKMYAIGFLQLKDPLQTMKSATPSLTSVLSQSFRLLKRRPEAESTAKFIKELQNDLEVVYVGQLCLSWEFLHWQYLKARELLESDPYETRRYNEVAGEFQQFQVLIQRFLENEPFQGPRVQNYIKNRCILRNLLQVPVIKEDSKDKDGRRRKDAITCSMLFQIIEESMRIYWEFLRADKKEGNLILKGLLRPQIELHDPEDSELLLDVQTNLQKKDKKLKELLRIGNCIVRRFQKHHEEQPNQVLFYSQVDLKLVSRVLHMSKITSDQLVWCLKKLNKITLVDRKSRIESSFLPFPC